MKGLTVSPKEQRRVQVLNRMLAGEVGVPQAAVLLGVGERQAWRLLAAYRKEGAAAVAHGNRGRAPWNRCPEGVRQRVVTLAQEARYAGCNDTHFSELLGEQEELALSRATVRRLLRAAGLRSPRKRRAPKHRSRRERMPQAGMLLQWDGSPHDWLEGRGPRLTLVGAIDDATGVPVAGHFRLQEDGQGYLLVLRDVLRTQGIPLAIYRDRHMIFERPDSAVWTQEEELAGERFPTQVERALAELGIRSIAAHSPQAKGRIERLWQTWQDRLVVELRLAGARTLEEADRVLQQYLPCFGRQFSVPAAQAGSAYRPLPPGLDLETVCCFKYQRTAGNDNTVRLGEHRLQIRADGQRASYARATVEVQERLDGSLAVAYQGRCLVTTAAPLEAPVLRARGGRRVPQPPRSAAATVQAQAGGTPSPALPDNEAPQLPGSVPASPAAARSARKRRPPRPAAHHPWRTSLKAAVLTESLTN